MIDFLSNWFILNQMIKIEDIEQGSYAEEIGLKVGSYLVSIDGKEINDVLDLRFFEASRSLDILVSSGNERSTYHIEKEPEIPLGIKPVEFETMWCENNCSFCFINQNPPDVRESLLVKDDDYRLSFLYGNYITLTNFKEKDFERVMELRLSPLYISVHTTDPEKRTELMRNPRAGGILDDIKRLVNGGIRLHTQIVLIPGFNDGEYLHKAIEDLLSLFPDVESIGVIPVGLTIHRDELLPIETPTVKWMEEIIQIVQPYQEEMKRKTGNSVVYLADEFYLKTGTEIPSASHYGSYPQLENGIGMVRQFLEGLKDLSVPDFEGRVLLVTGILGAGVISKLAKVFSESNVEVDVLPVRNRYFGNSVEVASLLGGWDLLGVISVLNFDEVILPPDIVNSDHLFIDGCSLEDFHESLSMDVHIAPYDISNLGEMK